MNNLHLKLLLIGLALVSIVIALHYNLGTFQSAPADPTCPRGRYSKKTGGVCTGPSSDKYDYSKDLPETVIGAAGERHNIGTYDSNPNKKDEIDYSKTDVLTKPASITYRDWVLDPKTNTDINSGSRVSNWQFRGTDDVIEDEDGLPSGRTSKDPYDYRYDTTLASSRNFRNSGYHDEFDTSKKHEYAKKNRPTVDELIKASPRDYSEIPTFKKNSRSHEEDDYLDNRLSRDYKTRERQFELPYEKTYNREPTQGYNTGATCNSGAYGNDGEPLEEDECCEGFSTLK
jgi:hypothetical protein